jgi:hypothetical protein
MYDGIYYITFLNGNTPTKPNILKITGHTKQFVYSFFDDILWKYLKQVVIVAQKKKQIYFLFLNIY